MADAAGNAAVAAIGKGEGTQRGTVVGAIGGHGSLQKERLDLGFLGSLAEARRTSEQEYYTRTVIRDSTQNSVVLQFPVTDNESGLQRFG